MKFYHQEWAQFMVTDNQQVVGATIGYMVLLQIWGSSGSGFALDQVLLRIRSYNKPGKYRLIYIISE